MIKENDIRISDIASKYSSDTKVVRCQIRCLLPTYVCHWQKFGVIHVTVSETFMKNSCFLLAKSLESGEGNEEAETFARKQSLLSVSPNGSQLLHDTAVSSLYHLSLSHRHETFSSQ